MPQLKMNLKVKTPWIVKIILDKQNNDQDITIPDPRLYFRAILKEK